MIRNKAKPFLKWAGGKAQLLGQYEKFYPPDLKSGKITRYFEPFLGGGAVFFDIAQKYSIKKAYLYDINKELILVYKVVQKNAEGLIKELGWMQTEFQKCREERRKDFYYGIRKEYNKKRLFINYDQFGPQWIERAAQMIFLNRTCFNGLFRLNRSGEFNVPFGKYKNPRILDADNLRRASRVLQIAELRAADFSAPNGQVTPDSFVYYDPPYRPISRTSAFTTYSSFKFDDEEQRRLAKEFNSINKKGANVMLSNSDPQNMVPADDFFDQLFKQHRIIRVPANRCINRNGSSRGLISEILVMNY